MTLEAGLPLFLLVLTDIRLPPRLNFGAVLTPNEPNSPAGVLTAVVFGVSSETELSLVEAIDATEDALLAAIRRLLNLLVALGGIWVMETLCRTRREVGCADRVDLTADSSEDALSERSSTSTSDEFSTNVRDVAFLSSELRGLPVIGVAAARITQKSANMITTVHRKAKSVMRQVALALQDSAASVLAFACFKARGMMVYVRESSKVNTMDSEACLKLEEGG
jgi:hypothetical protein